MNVWLHSLRFFPRVGVAFRGPPCARPVPGWNRPEIWIFRWTTRRRAVRPSLLDDTVVDRPGGGANWRTRGPARKIRVPLQEHLVCPLHHPRPDTSHSLASEPPEKDIPWWHRIRLPRLSSLRCG